MDKLKGYIKVTSEAKKKEALEKLGKKCVIVPHSIGGSHNYTIGKKYSLVSFNSSDSINDSINAKNSVGWIGNIITLSCLDVFIPVTKVKQRNLMKIVVMPDDMRALILATIEQAKDKTHERIFVKWGFGDVLEKGKGCILLFWGEPGCGKTMTAEAIAELLNKPLMICSSGDFQSAIPGQTEQNIQKAFDEAGEEDAVLLLDEADSVAYDRNQVGAILSAEINALLTAIERFEGVCILTTNRSDKLDTALNRRISLKLEFCKPDRESRKKIWRNLIPKKCPLGTKVCFDELSQFELTGGQIKNAILTGARLGANMKEKRMVKRVHLLQGIKRELLGNVAFDRCKEVRISGGTMDITQDMSVERRLTMGEDNA